MSSNNSKKTYYTWEQVEEALSLAGVTSTGKVRDALIEAVDYSGEAVQGPDSEEQEKLEPRAAAEKAWADMHRIQVFDPAPETADGTEKATSEVDAAQKPQRASSTSAPEVSPSFARIRQMMS